MSGEAPLEIELVEDAAGIRACWPVMVQLRPHLDEEAFVEQVQRQRLLGYRLVAGHDGEAVVVVAGFVLGEKLAWGRHLYVDDLVTDGDARSRGAGATMLAWLRRHAVDAGCASLHLDSGLQRIDAHRFYAREGLEHTSAHFVLSLEHGARGSTSVHGERARQALRRLRTGTEARSGVASAAEADRNDCGSARMDFRDDAVDRAGGGGDDHDDHYGDDYDPSHEGGLDPDFR